MRSLLRCALLLAQVFVSSGRDLEAYFIDVEGGKATLIVSPAGESLLIDAGLPGFNNRDANRIAEAAKIAGVTRIDNLVTTHYHVDHVGGVPQLAPNCRSSIFWTMALPSITASRVYVSTGSTKKSLQKAGEFGSRPGDTIPLKLVEVRVVTAGGAVLASPLAGAGQQNSECAGVHRDYSGSENAQSVGLLITYGELRLLDLGDLTGDTERQLVCPVNKIGTITVFVASHHGNDDANSPSLVHAIRPRVAVIGNGALHGAAPRTIEILRKTPGLEDIWQLHYSVLASMSHNAPLQFIVNKDQNCKGKWLKLTAHRDGSLTVYNAGTGFAKQYGAKLGCCVDHCSLLTMWN